MAWWISYAGYEVGDETLPIYSGLSYPKVNQEAVMEMQQVGVWCWMITGCPGVAGEVPGLPNDLAGSETLLKFIAEQSQRIPLEHYGPISSSLSSL